MEVYTAAPERSDRSHETELLGERLAVEVVAVADDLAALYLGDAAAAPREFPSGRRPAVVRAGVRPADDPLDDDRLARGDEVEDLAAAVGKGLGELQQAEHHRLGADHGPAAADADPLALLCDCVGHARVVAIVDRVPEPADDGFRFGLALTHRSASPRLHPSAGSTSGP